MFDSIIRFSLENKLVVLLGVAVMAVLGVYSATRIPLDAVPDITNNQVQIVSVAPTYAPEEVEQLITYPLEAVMTNIPDVLEVRSISRYGLSVITVVFEEFVEVLKSRQYVQEQLNVAAASLPTGVETELMPITTGLGEIYQYVLTVAPEYVDHYDATQLRTIQDWIVKRQLNGTPGIIDVSGFGGYLKQYEVAVDPLRLKQYRLSLSDVTIALAANNENSGSSYLERDSYAYYIRTEGKINQIEEIGNTPISREEGPLLRIRDVATVTVGSAKRYGAMTMDGKGEVVGGATLMLKGANSSEALANVKERIAEISASLPEGVAIYPYLDRSRLIGKTIATVRNNLVEGGLIVIFVLLLLLGNLRAGLVVASVIPLSMLFALNLMHYFGISANLMSLGAIDFGIVIDGAVIVVESLLHVLAVGYVGKRLTQSEFDAVVEKSTANIYRSAAFGVLIILLVFLPILSLEGTEGKTFRPMAQTVSFALLGSLILSVTYVPVMTSLVLRKTIRPATGFAARLMTRLQSWYRPIVSGGVRRAVPTLVLALAAFMVSLLVFNRLGAEFIPTLEEGDIAMQQSVPPGSSLQESIRTATRAEAIILANFPEVEHIVSKIGTAEVPTDPMSIEDADIMVILKDKEEWTSAGSREELMDKMKAKLESIPWANYEFTQPIQLRFNELMTGAKSDISVKIFGEDPAVLRDKANEAVALIQNIEGAGDVRADQTEGLRQLSVRFNRDQLARFGLTIAGVNQVIRAAFAGEIVGDVYENERKFDLVVRLQSADRERLELDRLTATNHHGEQIPLSNVAAVVERESPMLISRERARRFINIGVNVRDRDVEGLVTDVRKQLFAELNLPPGYEIQFGGQFENLQSARRRLTVAVPAALLLILFLLYLAFRSFSDAFIIFAAVPLSAIGGIMALWLREMPFSISSGIGFIALFGISVLNGIVLLSAIRQLREERSTRLQSDQAIDQQQGFSELAAIIVDAATTRLRPVLMTAAVAAFGFLPMALSDGNGAEVQRPLATVVIGGLLSSTLLTLVVLPALYQLVNRRHFLGRLSAAVILFFGFVPSLSAQPDYAYDAVLQHVLTHHPAIAQQRLVISANDLDRDAIGQWAPLQFDYQGGQINAGAFDHFFSISQPIDHFLGKRVRLRVIDRREAALSADGRRIARGIGYQLSLAYADWAYAIARESLADSTIALYHAMEERINLRLSSGAISPLEKALFDRELSAYRTRSRQARRESELAELRIRELALLGDTVNLRPPEWRPLPLPILENIAPANVFREVRELHTQTLDAERDKQLQLAKQPSLSVGYFHQSLIRKFGFQGVNLSLGIPLDRRSAKARDARLVLEQEQLQLLGRATENRMQLRLSELSEQIDQLHADLLSPTVAGQVVDIITLARRQLAAGAIDFLTFSRTLTQLLSSEHLRLEQLHQYNTLVLEFLHLSQN